MTAKSLLIIGLLIGLISCGKENIVPTGNEKLTKIETYNPTNQKTSITEYEYDDSDNLVEIRSMGTFNEVQTLLYDASGRIVSNTLTNSVSGNVYKYDFQTDQNGRIIRATGTSFLPNLVIYNHLYTYDTQGRLIIDSVVTQSDSIHSYVNFRYDKNNNVIAYQQYVNNDLAVILVNSMTFQYDTGRSPYFNVGQILYTSLGGSGVSYFYLSKNNPTSATLNGADITPDGSFVYQYYPNSLLKTSSVNVPNTIRYTFFYAE